MNFIDKVGKTITDVSQRTVAKTKEFADIATYKSKIMDEEKIIEDKYIELAKKYIELHKNPEKELKNIVETINQCKLKITDYEKQMQDIKGVVHCEKCGAEISEDASFCSVCGCKLKGEANAKN